MAALARAAIPGIGRARRGGTGAASGWKEEGGEASEVAAVRCPDSCFFCCLSPLSQWPSCAPTFSPPRRPGRARAVRDCADIATGTPPCFSHSVWEGAAAHGGRERGSERCQARRWLRASPLFLAPRRAQCAQGGFSGHSARIAGVFCVGTAACGRHSGRRGRSSATREQKKKKASWVLALTRLLSRPRFPLRLPCAPQA